MSLGKKSGKLRLADSGLGWKAENSGEPFTTPASDLRAAHWHKASRGFELKLIRNRGPVLRFDGFGEGDLDELASALSDKYKIELQQHDIALKGWNWGKTEFNGSELSFLINNKNSFDLPLQYVTNTNLTGKQEVSVEFALPGEADDDEKDARKEARNTDQMVEMRFYVPGNMVKGDESGDEEQSNEEVSAAQTFYDTLKDKADVGEVAGDAIASFSDVTLLTPRYDQNSRMKANEVVVGMISTCIRLRCVCAARRMTTRCNTRQSSTCSCFHVAMTRMSSSWLA